jgi:hypothetical protein
LILGEPDLLGGEAGQFPCPKKDASEHGSVEATGVGVAQGRVIGSEKMQTVGEKILGAMGETVLGFAGDDAGFKQKGEVAVKGYLPETNGDTDSRQSLDLCRQMGGAVADLLGMRFVAGRGAADDRGYPRMAKLEAVVAVDGPGLAGQAEFMQDGVHEITGAVAGKGPAGAICSVRPRGKAENEDPSAWVTKTWNGPCPIGLILVGAALSFADTAAVVAQTWAALTCGDGVVNLLEELGRNLCAGGCHCIP